MMFRPAGRLRPLLRGPIRPGQEHAGFRLLQVQTPDPRRLWPPRGGRVTWLGRGLEAVSPRPGWQVFLVRDPSPGSRLLGRVGQTLFVGRAGVDIFIYLPGTVFSPNLAATVFSPNLLGTVKGV